MDQGACTSLKCGVEVPADTCSDTCSTAADGSCDDGGLDSDHAHCTLGTDCTDCGARTHKVSIDCWRGDQPLSVKLVNPQRSLAAVRCCSQDGSQGYSRVPGTSTCFSAVSEWVG